MENELKKDPASDTETSKDPAENIETVTPSTEELIPETPVVEKEEIDSSKQPLNTQEEGSQDNESDIETVSL